MAEVRVLPQEQVVRIVANADPREFSLFLGAGASRSSGVVLASEMIREWRQIAFREQRADEMTDADFDAWVAAQPWAAPEKSDEEYSTLFEMLYPDERARQRYIEPKIEAAFPGWGYLYLANLIKAGRINLVFTTNFDDLVNDALTRFMGYNAVVCAADSEVASINVATARAKIVKLHGDYLFKSLKNTRSELERLTTNMGRKFSEFAKQCGMIVMGYAGGDQSIMSVLDEILSDPETFPSGLYWGVHDVKAKRAGPLERLLAKHARLRLFRCEDFDLFMASLNRESRLGAPPTVAEPLRAAREGFDRLVTQTTSAQASNTIVAEHLQMLKAQLGGAIAQADAPDTIDLFEAQIALSTRKYADALERVERYVRAHPNDASAMTIWGSALMMQSEEEGRRELADAAERKWREAVALDRSWTPARYNLLRHYSMRQQFPDAIEQAEALEKLAPRDASLRLNLAQLYNAVSRTREALVIVEQLLVDDPDNVTLHVNHAALLESRGQTSEALAAITRAVQLAPAHPWVRMQAAQSFARVGRPMEAGSEFAQAIQADPRNTAFRVQAATFYLSTNQAPQALLHLREAARLEPDSAEVKGWLASAYMATGALPDAQREIEAALRIEQRDSRLLSTAAQIYMFSNQPDRAEQCLKLANSVNPSASAPLAMLAQLYASWGRWPQFQSTLQQVAMIDPAAAAQLQRQFAQVPGGMPQYPQQPGNIARGIRDWLGIPRE